MSRVEVSSQVSPELRALIDGASGDTRTYAEISSNLAYILALEYGSSDQAPNGGIIRTYLEQYERWVAEEFEAAWQTHAPDIETATAEAITMAALRILRAIADRTPLDTGRAKGDWVARLPGGKLQREAPVVTAEQQAAIRKTAAWKAKERARRRARKGNR